MPDGVTSEWHGDAVLAAIDEATRTGLAAVGDYFVDALRERVGTPGPEPSEPGEPPHKQSGELYDAIRWETTPDGQGVEIVCDAEESVWTELGTARMQPRPWFSSTLQELQGQAADVFARAAQGGQIPVAPAAASASSAAPPAHPQVKAAPYQMRGNHGLKVLALAREAVGWARATLAKTGAAISHWVRHKWR